MPSRGAAGSLERLPEGQDQIGPFRLVARIGSGRRTTAYLALSEDPRDPAGSLWTLRRLHAGVDRDAFLQELKINRGIIVGHHTHIHELDGALWTQSPAIIGESLQSILEQTFAKRQPINLDIALSIGIKAAFVLSQLAGKVHGDLVPHHVILGYDGTVSLIDPAGPAYKGRLGAKDRLGYQSPEHIARASLTPTSDVFSLGVLMFELTCARRLFEGPDAKAVEKKIQSGDFPRPRDIVGDGYPIELQLILRKLLRPQAAGRFINGTAAHDALNLVATTRAPPTQRQLGDWLKIQFPDRHRLWSQLTDTTQAAASRSVKKEIHALRATLQEHSATIPDGLPGAQELPTQQEGSAQNLSSIVLQANELDTVEEKLDQLLGFQTPPPLPAKQPPGAARSKTRPLPQFAAPRAKTEIDGRSSLRAQAMERSETVRENAPLSLEPQGSLIPTNLDEIEASDVKPGINSDWGELTPFSIPPLGSTPSAKAPRAGTLPNGAQANPPARNPLPRADSFDIDEDEALELLEELQEMPSEQTAELAPVPSVPAPQASAKAPVPEPPAPAAPKPAAIKPAATKPVAAKPAAEPEQIHTGEIEMSLDLMPAPDDTAESSPEKSQPPVADLQLGGFGDPSISGGLKVPDELRSQDLAPVQPTPTSPSNSVAPALSDDLQLDPPQPSNPPASAPASAAADLTSDLLSAPQPKPAPQKAPAKPAPPPQKTEAPEAAPTAPARDDSLPLEALQKPADAKGESPKRSNSVLGDDPLEEDSRADLVVPVPDDELERSAKTKRMLVLSGLGLLSLIGLVLAYIYFQIIVPQGSQLHPQPEPPPPTERVDPPVKTPQPTEPPESPPAPPPEPNIEPPKAVEPAEPVEPVEPVKPAEPPAALAPDAGRPPVKRARVTRIKVRALPSNATILVDGKKVSNGATIRIGKKTVRIESSAEGFETQVRTVRPGQRKDVLLWLRKKSE